MLLLPASINVNDARDALDMLAQSLKRDGSSSAEAVLDASALQQFDSSALAVLVTVTAMSNSAIGLPGNTGAWVMRPRVRAA